MNERVFVKNSGLRCTETYGYKETYDEVDKNIPVIDFDNKKQTIYNSEFQLSRLGNISEVISYPVNDGGYIGDNSKTTGNNGWPMSDHPVYKKDYLNKISSPPIVGVDIEVNRGNTSAFEKHFKLTECNTLEDLENYGNNIFNL